MSGKVPDGQYVGAVLRRRNVAGLTLAETSYARGTIVDAHAHDTPLASLVVEGSMTEERGRSAARLKAGELLYQPPDEAHAHRFHDGGATCFIVQFGRPWMERMSDLGVLRPDVPLDFRRSRAGWLLAQVREASADEDVSASLTVEGLSIALLGELSRTKEHSERGARPGWLVRAVEILHAHKGGDLRMADIAAAVGVHPVHLSRTFRAFYGCTMGEYLRRLRVERAAERLRSSDAPLSTVALEAGFADQAHFTRVFKKHTGATPAVFRAERRTR